MVLCYDPDVILIINVSETKVTVIFWSDTKIHTYGFSYVKSQAKLNAKMSPVSAEYFLSFLVWQAEVGILAVVGTGILVF